MNLLDKLIAGELTISQVLYYVTTQYKDKFEPNFIRWAEQECNGYEDIRTLPEYRYMDCEVFVSYMDCYGQQYEHKIDTQKFDKYLSDNIGPNAILSRICICEKIELLEKTIEECKGDFLRVNLHPEQSNMIKQCIPGSNNYRSFMVYQRCPRELGVNAITEIKNKLISTLNKTKMNDDKTIYTDKHSDYPLIFVSHSSKDKNIIKLFIDNILKKGLGLRDKNIVFTSYEATGILPGDNIPEYIKNNIGCANIVLSMISNNYKSSEVCMNEVGAAWALGKRPLQIMMPNTNFDKLGWLIQLDKAARIDDGDSLDSLGEVISSAMKLPMPTPRHWNPCKNDFLNSLKAQLNSNNIDNQN